MANKRFTTGNFIPKNPAKYTGSYPIVYRSSWELKVMQVFDEHPYILQWSSEGIPIPYYNPVHERMANYFPDFLITQKEVSPTGIGFIERKVMIEVKPENQTVMEKAKGTRNKIEMIINDAKWKSAIRWCDERDIVFRVMTEKDLFHTASRKK